jgi:hypothetical protein
MRFLLDTPIDVDNSTQYIIVKQHRQQVNQDKSWWTISYQDEYDCFVLTYRKSWTSGNLGWGLHIENSCPAVLGKSPTGMDLKVAKFIVDSTSSYWHGYPVDYKDKKRLSCPPESILKLWVTEKIITKPQMLRLMGGKKCAL